MSDTSNVKILMLTSTLPRWPGDSTPRFVLDLVVNLSGLGWPIDMLAPGYQGALVHEELEGVTVHRFPYMIPSALQTLCYDGGIMPNIRANPAKAALVPPFLSAAVVAARRLINRLRPSVVHAHWIVPMGLAAVLAAPRGTPVVVTVHGSDVLDLGGPILNRLKSRVLTRADVITCNGSRTESAVAKLVPPDKRIVRIPMGARKADPDSNHGFKLPQGRFTILFAGRLFGGKGLDDLLDALAGFNTGQCPFLLVAGTGPEQMRLKARAATLNLESDVKFLGGVEHDRLLTLMRDVNAVVAPTRSAELTEAQGLVIAEAMQAGTPVIATLGGGPEDYVRDGETGLLVPSADPAALRSAISRLMADAANARRIGENGMRYANDNLSWEASARAFDGLYRRVGSLSTSR